VTYQVSVFAALMNLCLIIHRMEYRIHWNEHDLIILMLYLVTKQHLCCGNIHCFNVETCVSLRFWRKEWMDPHVIRFQRTTHPAPANLWFLLVVRLYACEALYEAAHEKRTQRHWQLSFPR
jgi:hypothetical protein